MFPHLRDLPILENNDDPLIQEFVNSWDLPPIDQQIKTYVTASPEEAHKLARILIANIRRYATLPCDKEIFRTLAQEWEKEITENENASSDFLSRRYLLLGIVHQHNNLGFKKNDFQAIHYFEQILKLDQWAREEVLKWLASQ